MYLILDEPQLVTGLKKLDISVFLTFFSPIQHEWQGINSKEAVEALIAASKLAPEGICVLVRTERRRGEIVPQPILCISSFPFLHAAGA